MQVIPALDLLGEDAVRLEQGDFNRVLFRQPLEEFMGRLVGTHPALIHVVDLQGARDGALRPAIIDRCRRAARGVPLQVTGGLRSLEAARDALSAGATRVVVGTQLWQDDLSLGLFVKALGERLVVALDVKEGRLAVRGWVAFAPFTLDQALERCLDVGVARLHVTAVERDGTHQGPDLKLYERVCALGIPVVAAGGVRSDDLETLAQVGCEAVVMGVGYLDRLGLVLE
jgi:phosphoribosylformimino-5-aminoimidazole carboxamide ribotide isomerase